MDFADMYSTVVDDVGFNNLMTVCLENLRQRITEVVTHVASRCNGLLVFGEEYSTITRSEESSALVDSRKSGSAAIFHEAI